MGKHKENMKEIFYKVQKSSSTHRKSLSILQNIFNETDFNEFVIEFVKYLTIILLEDRNDTPDNPHAIRTFKFVIDFCLLLDKKFNDEDTGSPFLLEICSAVLKLHNIPQVRYRMCRFINMLLREMGENDATLEEEIYVVIRDIMFDRLEDVKVCIRYQAIEVLHRLQDPLDPKDAIIKTLINCLPDPSALVRKAIVQNIVINVTTIPHILSRCLDTDDNVRLASYDRISKVFVKALTLEQRQFVLRNGFKDKNPKVLKYIENTLLPQWFLNCDEDYFKFILALKLDADENDYKQTVSIVEKVLDIFFRKHDFTKVMEALPLNEKKILSKVDWEEAVFWRCLIQYLRKKEDDELLEKIVPDLILFCEFIKNVYKSRSTSKPHTMTDWEIMVHNNIMLEMLQICEGYDYSDEVGRRELYTIIRDILTDAVLSYNNTLILVRIFEQLNDNIEAFTHEVCLILSDIREPLVTETSAIEIANKRKKELQLAEYKMQINMAQFKQETAVELKQYVKAEELKKVINNLQMNISKITKEFEEEKSAKIRVIKNDVATLCKCLDLLIALLMSPRIHAIPEIFKSTLNVFVQPLLVSTNADIFNRVLRIYGLCCSINEDMAKEYFNVFTTQIIATRFTPTYDVPTVITAVECVGDLLLIYKTKLIEDAESSLNMSKKTKKRQLFSDSQVAEDQTLTQTSETVSYESLINALSMLLDDTTTEIREKVTEILVKLICHGLVHSPMLLSKLILKWFSPASVKDQRMRQLIGLLFIEYVPKCPTSMEVLEEAFISTLTTLVNAPRNSPLADVDIDSTIHFLTALCRPGSHQYNQGLNTHKNIALRLCQEICDRPNNIITIYFLKTLTLLEPPQDDEITLSDLKKQVNIMLELVTNKKCLKYVSQYKHILGNEEITLTTNNIDGLIATSTSLNATNIVRTSNNQEKNTNLNTIENDSNAINIPIENDSNAVNTPIENDSNAVNIPEKYSALSVSVNRRKRIRKNNAQEVSSNKVIMESLNTLKHPEINQTDSDSNSSKRSRKSKSCISVRRSARYRSSN